MLGTWKMKAVAEKRVVYMCVRAQIEFKMSVLYSVKIRASSR